MGFFVSPAAFITLITHRKAIEDLLKPRDKSWYFSDEGLAAYAEADSIAKKCRLFYDYLRTFTSDTIALKLAYIMAHSMVNSTLKFGGYPNVIDPDKNPLVKFFLEKNKYYTTSSDLWEYLLNALHEQGSPSRYLTFKDLTYCKEEDPLFDLYCIERDIILLFDDNAGGTLPTIFNRYRIPTDQDSSADGEDEDLEDEDLEDEDLEDEDWEDENDE